MVYLFYEGLLHQYFNVQFNTLISVLTGGAYPRDQQPVLRGADKVWRVGGKDDGPGEGSGVVTIKYTRT